ncbi:MAG: ribonuclease M5 [Eubacteriaceae bacterium]|jgi:ribonuclease M5|nr:ribonuclease M5 [Eubacteriaceae bacterium]
MKIKEVIVVEGRDDTAAVRRALDTDTIETHGFGISDATWEMLEKAYSTRGLIIFTDPDHAGETIRSRLTERFPDARQAFLPRDEAEKKGDIGIENAGPEAILEALAKARATKTEGAPVFDMKDMYAAGLAGGAGSSARRRELGKALGIGYGNAAGFLRKLNDYGITKEEFERHLNR